MLKRLPAARARELVARASATPVSDPRVKYPRWYLHRWHFLPEGYLSARSAAGYENVIRRVYYQGTDARLNRSVVGELEGLNPGSILEVGCGPGRLLEAISEAGFSEGLVGVDLSPYLLERAARRLDGRTVRLAHADGLTLPAAEGSFDVAVAAHYVGHLPRALRGRALKEIARVVRPGGHVILIDHRWHGLPATPGTRRIRMTRHNAGLIEMTTLARDEIGGAP